MVHGLVTVISSEKNEQRSIMNFTSLRISQEEEEPDENAKDVLVPALLSEIEVQCAMSPNEYLGTASRAGVR